MVGLPQWGKSQRFPVWRSFGTNVLETLPNRQEENFLGLWSHGSICKENWKGFLLVNAVSHWSLWHLEGAEKGFSPRR